jgi:hypothetical protein
MYKDLSWFQSSTSKVLNSPCSLAQVLPASFVVPSGTQVRDLRSPPKTLFDILETLALHAPIFVKEVRKELENSQ